MITNFFSRIAEKARKRKHAIQFLNNDTVDRIADHLFLLAHHPLSQDVPHWISELKSWHAKLVRYNKSRNPSGSNYSPKDLKERVWNDPLGTIGDLEVLSNLAWEDKGIPKVPVQFERTKALAMEFIQSVLDNRAFDPKRAARKLDQ